MCCPVSILPTGSSRTRSSDHPSAHHGTWHQGWSQLRPYYGPPSRLPTLEPSSRLIHCPLKCPSDFPVSHPQQETEEGQNHGALKS